jgi:hypothetical protein
MAAVAREKTTAPIWVLFMLLLPRVGGGWIMGTTMDYPIIGSTNERT